MHNLILLQLLNIDLGHIEAKIADILKHDHTFVLLQGELIGRQVVTDGQLFMYVQCSFLYWFFVSIKAHWSPSVGAVSMIHMYVRSCISPHACNR